jgi:RND family efflux transporter MFP subunit
MFKKNKKNLILVLTALMPLMSAQAENIPAIDCMIEPNIMVELSSPVAGVLDTLTVDKSDEVKKGQLVATLKSEVELVSVQTSTERLKLSNLEHKRAAELYREKAITLSDKDKSENEKNLFELELQQAQANLDLRQIKSPIDAVVVKRYAMPGEFVETKPILQLAQLDPLKIEVVSPVSNYGKIIKGMRAKILPEFGEYENLVAEVVVVDKVIDAASGTFGVRLELANKDHTIPGGLKCRVSFIDEIVKAQPAETSNITTAQIVPAMPMPGNNVDSDASDSDASGSDVTSNEIITPLAENTENLAADETVMCSSLGPYKNRETLTKLLDELASDLKQTDLRTDKEVKTTYVVLSKRFSSASEVTDSMKRMSASGIKDIAKVKVAGKHHISFGLYSRQVLAKNRVVELNNKGYEVILKPRNKQVTRYWADVTYSPQSIEMLNILIPESNRVACKETIKLSLLKN